jgi:hypothetical protein
LSRGGKAPEKGDRFRVHFAVLGSEHSHASTESCSATAGEKATAPLALA